MQIEVDAGYETPDSIILLEAKIGSRSDFNVRQLVYPYLHWSQRSTEDSADLLNIQGRYVLIEFAIDENDFGKVDIVSNRAFRVNASPIIELTELLRTVRVGPEPPEVPFPQADDMDKVVGVIERLGKGAAGRTAIAEFFQFDERQSGYYANAAEYLGFAVKSKDAGGDFELTQLGSEFLALPAGALRTQSLLRQMLQRPSLRDCLELLRRREFDLDQVSPAELNSIIESRTVKSLAVGTLSRRAVTVRRWLNWLLKNISLGKAG